MSGLSDQAQSFFDAGRVVGGAFRGFWVLLLGGLLEPVVGEVAPALIPFWLPLVALTAFAAASIAATTPTGRWQQGPAAAVASYMLIVPLVRVSTGALPLLLTFSTTAVAVLVGTTVGLMRRHRAWQQRDLPNGTGEADY